MPHTDDDTTRTPHNERGATAVEYALIASLIAAIIILSREILVSGLREFLAEVRVRVPVTQLAKWKTTMQMVALGFLICGPAGDRFVPYVSYIGLLLLWVSALLTLYTGYDYLRAGLRHLMSEET